ncbi:hypothetical protein BJV77DRAFT_1032065, partial [Russula vinacea]
MVLRREDFVSVRPANCRTEELQKECGRPDTLTFLWTPFNPTPTELLVVSLRFSALGRGLLWRHTDALRGWILALSFEAGFAREEISAVVAEGDLEWVCLHGVIVALKVTLCLESNIGTEAALDRYEGSRRTSRTIVSRKMCPFSFWATDVVKPALGTTQGTTSDLPCYPAIIHP